MRDEIMTRRSKGPRRSSVVRLATVALVSAVIARAAVGGLLRRGIAADLHVGRRRRDLGPIRMRIEAAPEVVFDVIAQPYLVRTPRAMAAKLEVLERGGNFAVAAHHTSVSERVTATTVELVTFERPERIAFRLLRGPVAAASETFHLRPAGEGTAFEYDGHLEADFWALGTWWLGVVAARWERSVQTTLDSVRHEAERRASATLARNAARA